MRVQDLQREPRADLIGPLRGLAAVDGMETGITIEKRRKAERPVNAPAESETVTERDHFFHIPIRTFHAMKCSTPRPAAQSRHPAHPCILRRNM